MWVMKRFWTPDEVTRYLNSLTNFRPETAKIVYDEGSGAYIVWHVTENDE
jgi:hypothetical protein